MRYVSIDIETLGLDPDYCDTIEFGAVIEDTSRPRPIEELPTYHAYLTKPKDRYQGEVYAMYMHSKSGMFERIAKRTPGFNYIPHDMLGENFFGWLSQEGLGEIGARKPPAKITVAGKNFMAFDMRFLRRLPDFEKCIKIEHREMNPAMQYMLPTDEKPPSLQTCLERAGINTEVKHTAVEDALDVIRLIRYKLRD